MSDEDEETKGMLKTSEDEKRTMKIGDVVEEIGTKPSLVIFLYVLMTVSPFTVVCVSLLSSNFAGRIPYKNWKCNETSILCMHRTNTFLIEADLKPDSGSQYSYSTLCGGKGEEELQVGVDFVWDIGNRTTYGVDWGLHCSREYMATFVSSAFFVGAIIGLLIGGTIFDTFGRKLSSIVALGVGIAGMFICAGAQNIAMIIVGRIVQGSGCFVAISGMFILLMEFTPARYRVVLTSMSSVAWSSGYFLIAFLGYQVQSWRWLLATAGFIGMVDIVILFLLPESARYYLVNKGDKKRAKEVLAWVAAKASSDFDIDSVELEEVYEVQPSLLETLKDFVKYKEMTIEFVLQLWMWMVVGFLYYGFNFSWSKFGNNIYLSYLYGAIGDMLGWVFIITLLTLLPRRKAVITFYMTSGVMFLIAMIPVNFGTGAITLEQLACLIGNSFVLSAFFGDYLYASELAPTSHRGKFFTGCSLAARIGALCGPQAALLFEWNRMGTLALFFVLAASAGLVTFRLPETKGIPILNTAAEVQERRLRGIEGVKYKPEAETEEI